MPRKKKITTEVLQALAEKYMLDTHVDHIDIPDFGRYIRDNGYPDVQDYIIRRDQQFRNYIDDINTKSSEQAMITVATYATLDINQFLLQNSSVSKLREALRERDDYYHRVAMAAGHLNEMSKSALKEKQDLEEQVRTLTAKLEALTSEKAHLKAKLTDLKDLKKANKRLRKIITDIVYPEVASSLLQDEGQQSKGSSMIDPDKLESIMVRSSTDIPDLLEEISDNEEPEETEPAFANSVVAELMEGLDNA